jgi:N-methylhydantoinase B
MMPVFHGGRVVGFTACTSHLVDLGGRGMGPEGSDIFDEGLLIPPCKLVDRGAVNALLLEIVKANSREPIANEGDIYALIACCEAGARRLGDDGRVRAGGARPAGGLHHRDLAPGHARRHRGGAAGHLRPPAAGGRLRGGAGPLRRADHRPEGASSGFRGQLGLLAKGINVPLNYATAYSVFALRCLIGPDIPNNAGSLEPFTVTAPPGLHPERRAPAPVAMRHTFGQMTPDLVLAASRRPADRSRPRARPACTTCRCAARPRRMTGGARPSRWSWCSTAAPARGPKATGCRPPPSQRRLGQPGRNSEAVAPVLIHRRELRPDSGGPGRMRGGLGQRIEMSAATDQDVLVFLSVERVHTPAAGRHGGRPGAAGRIRIGEDGADLPPKGTIRIPSGQTLVFETPGGGGFGPPERRSDADLARDLETGLVTDAAPYGRAS